MKHAVAAGLLAASLAASPATAASRLEPAQPYAFDPIDLRMDVDSCVFDPYAVSVSASNGVISVLTRANNCLVPGPQRVVDIRLGSLPAGAWRVEVLQASGPQPLAPVLLESIDFQVLERPAIAVFPVAPHPLTDYTGAWYLPAESGWGLSFHQSPAHIVFATWYVYDAAGAPTWYTIQLGRWESSTRWTGTVYRTDGPPFFTTIDFERPPTTVTAVGTASFEFEQAPGEVGYATFAYSVNGQAGTRRITRLRF